MSDRDGSVGLAICPRCRSAVDVFETAAAGACPSYELAVDPDDRRDQPKTRI